MDVFSRFLKNLIVHISMFFLFPMRTRGTNGTIASRQHERATTTTTRDHAREYDIEDTHVR